MEKDFRRTLESIKKPVKLSEEKEREFKLLTQVALNDHKRRMANFAKGISERGAIERAQLRAETKIRMESLKAPKLTFSDKVKNLIKKWFL